MVSNLLLYTLLLLFLVWLCLMFHVLWPYERTVPRPTSPKPTPPPRKRSTTPPP